jgi:transposase-like protein
MRSFVSKFVYKVPDLDHEERIVVRDALDGVNDYSKVCDLIESHLENNPNCPHCGKGRIYKHGIRSGLQRYRCPQCRKTFNALTNTPLAKLRKKELWLKYMDEMLVSTVLRKIALHIHVDKKTAFLWRHRFSTWLYKDAPQTLEGIVEADETYFRVSKKGCRTLNRTAHKHGGDDAVPGLSKKQVCVLTAADRTHHGLEFITGLGPVKGKWLDLFLTEHIAEDAVLVTDGLPSYSHFCREKHVKHVIVRSRKGERANGSYHIQHINAFHGRIKVWINRHFRGVATKYLNHYLWWRHELENKHICDSISLFQAVLC